MSDEVMGRKRSARTVLTIIIVIVLGEEKEPFFSVEKLTVSAEQNVCRELSNIERTGVL